MRLPLLLFLGLICVTSVARAQSGVAPKVAVLVSGDPDASLREAAQTLADELQAAGLRQPADPALRQAFVGAPAESADGLHAIRSIRRGLGLDPEQDLKAYRQLGRVAGADALAVVQRQAGRLSCEVFDVAAGQLYEGTLDLATSSTEERVAFVRSRAAEAQRRWAQQADEGKTEAAAAAAGLPPTAQAGAPEADQDSSAKRKMKKAWPWILVGGLLAAGVTYIIIDQSGDDGEQPPVLVFRPGRGTSEEP